MSVFRTPREKREAQIYVESLCFVVMGFWSTSIVQAFFVWRLCTLFKLASLLPVNASDVLHAKYFQRRSRAQLTEAYFLAFSK